MTKEQEKHITHSIAWVCRNTAERDERPSPTETKSLYKMIRDERIGDIKMDIRKLPYAMFALDVGVNLFPKAGAAEFLVSRG